MAGSDLVAVRWYGDYDGGDVLHPFVSPGGRLVLEHGEVAVLEFTAIVSGYQLDSPEFALAWGPLPAPARVVVTDRRVVFVCDRFTKGSSWTGFGVVGLTVAATASAASAAKAHRARAGRAAVGQVRFDWLGRVQEAGTARNPGVLLVAGHPVSPVALRLDTAPGDLRLDEDLVAFLAATTASFRLMTCHPDRQGAAELGDLMNGVARSDVAGGLSLPVPGHVDLPTRLPIPLDVEPPILRGADRAAPAVPAPPAPRAPSGESYSGARARRWPPNPPATEGWYLDPWGQGAPEHRWWNGTAWEEFTDDLVDADAGAEVQPQRLRQIGWTVTWGELVAGHGDRRTERPAGPPAPRAPSGESYSPGVARRWPPNPPATEGWYLDPWGQGAPEHRWWNGTAWEEFTDDLVDADAVQPAQEAQPAREVPPPATYPGRPGAPPTDSVVRFSAEHAHHCTPPWPSHEGWYPDPWSKVPGDQRWWNGTAWEEFTEHW